MIFSLISLFGILVSVFFIYRKKYVVSFLETSTPTPKSYRKSEKTRNRIFLHESGIVDLSKHPELVRFREISGTKEYLVELWKRDDNLYLKEGETKAVIFEFVKNGEEVKAIPCLRTVESILDGGDSLGVSWDGGVKVVDSETLLGIVKYESI